MKVRFIGTMDDCTPCRKLSVSEKIKAEAICRTCLEKTLNNLYSMVTDTSTITIDSLEIIEE